MINICNSSHKNNINEWYHRLISNDSSENSEWFPQLHSQASLNCGHLNKDDIKESTEFLLKAYSEGLISKDMFDTYIAFFLQCFIENTIDRRVSGQLEKFLSKLSKKLYHHE